MILGIKQLAPGNRMDYDVSAEDWLEDDDAVSTVTAVVDPADEIEVDDIEITSPTIKVWVTAGADAAEATYEIVLTITTTGGRIKTVCFKVRVKDC